MLPEYAAFLAAVEVLIFIILFLAFEYESAEGAAKGA